MTRKMIKHKHITNESKRNTTFKNRLEGLSKKVEELSVLCGVEAGFVIHTETENNVVQWPSPEVLRERMDRFLSFPEVEQGKKMVLQDKFLEEQLGEVKKNLMKCQNYNEVKEGRKLMNELIQSKPLNEFDSQEIKILHKYTAKRMEMMETGGEGTNDNGHDNNDNSDNINNKLVLVEGSDVPVPNDPEIAAPANDREMMIDEMKNDAWFSETTADHGENIKAMVANNDDGPN